MLDLYAILFYGTFLLAIVPAFAGSKGRFIQWSAVFFAVVGFNFALAASGPMDGPDGFALGIYLLLSLAVFLLACGLRLVIVAVRFLHKRLTASAPGPSIEDRS